MAERWAILSDVHANFPALEAVLADARAQGASRTLFLGDVVGYGPEPHRCIKRLRTEIDLGVLGNHDEAVCLLNGELPDEAPEAVRLRIGDNPDTWAALRKNYELLCYWPGQLEWLASQPRVTWLEQRIALIHGGLRHGQPTTTYTRLRLDVRDEFRALEHERPEIQIALVGHTHVAAAFRQAETAPADFEDHPVEPFVEQPLGGRGWLFNPGSVGQPRDGDPRASYLILDLERDLFEFRRALYRIDRVQQVMETLGMPKSLIDRLNP